MSENRLYSSPFLTTLTPCPLSTNTWRGGEGPAKLLVSPSPDFRRGAGVRYSEGLGVNIQRQSPF